MRAADAADPRRVFTCYIVYAVSGDSIEPLACFNSLRDAEQFETPGMRIAHLSLVLPIPKRTDWIGYGAEVVDSGYRIEDDYGEESQP